MTNVTLNTATRKCTTDKYFLGYEGENNINKLIFKFVASYIFTFLLNSLLLNILAEQLKLNDYLSQAVLILPMAMISFLIFKLWVFKEK